MTQKAPHSHVSNDMVLLLVFYFWFFFFIRLLSKTGMFFCTWLLAYHIPQRLHLYTVILDSFLSPIWKLSYEVQRTFKNFSENGYTPTLAPMELQKHDTLSVDRYVVKD